MKKIIIISDCDGILTNGTSIYTQDGKIAKIYDTKNERNGIELSYKDKEGTLLRRYFNINPSLDTNYIIVSCYLTAEEYTLLKKGANVIFDSDVYVVSEIRGYDPMGVNETELTLIKQN